MTILKMQIIYFSYKHLSKGQPLSGDKLRKELDDITSNLQYMMQHMNKLGSTQSNENFNNIVASKAPKNRYIFLIIIISKTFKISI